MSLDEHSAYYIKDPVVIFIFGIITLLVSVTLLTIFVWGPQAEADWQKEKSSLDSMTCYQLGKELVDKSTGLNSEGGHTQEYNYIDAKLRVGDCK